MSLEFALFILEYLALLSSCRRVTEHFDPWSTVKMHHLPYYYSPEQLKSYHNSMLAAASSSPPLFSIDNILAPRPYLTHRPSPYFPYPGLAHTPQELFGKSQIKSIQFYFTYNISMTVQYIEYSDTCMYVYNS